MFGSPTNPENGHGSAASNGLESTPALPPRFPIPERAAVPKPERLNRNALTIAAVVMGMLVLAAVVLLPPTRPSAPAGARTAPPPQEPTFLDQPAHPGRGLGGSPTGADEVAARNAARAALDSAALVSPGAASQWGGGAGRAGGSAAGYPPGAAGAPVVDAPRAYVVQTSPPTGASMGDLRAAAYQAAVMAAPTIRAGDDNGIPTVAVASVEGAGQGSGARAVSGVSSSSASATPPASRERFQQFLGDVQRPAPTTLRTAVQPAPGPHTVQAGTVIPAVLLTEVNSDLPGDVLAQVARDVYDSQTQQTLLLPKGAKLLGRYHDQIGVGQNRLLLAWTRVLFPDGRSIALPGLPTTDPAGAGGVADQVDRHGNRVFGTAALLSLIGAGAQLSQPRGGYGPWGTPSAGEVAAGAMGQQLAGVATQLLQRDLDVQPTIRIRQGMPFNVFLTADLTFPGAYEPTP